MNKLATIGLAGFAVVAILVIVAVLQMLNYYNDAVSMEQVVTAQYDQNRNDYTKMFNSFQESAQVPKQYTKDLKDVYDSAMKGRYGKDGSRAVVNWIKEVNPNFDSRLYIKIQTLIEANRNEFASNQKSLIDKKQIYNAYLQKQPQGMLLAFLGFPKIDMNKFDIVTSDATEAAFESKRGGPIHLFEQGRE